MAPRGGVMLGMSRTVSRDSVRSYEFIRIYRDGDALVFAAEPSGQSPAEFRSTAVSRNRVIFENLAHDFPQRIIYRRVHADSIFARVEATRDGRSSGTSFGYRRVACTR